MFDFRDELVVVIKFQREHCTEVHFFNISSVDNNGASFTKMPLDKKRTRSIFVKWHRKTATHYERIRSEEEKQ